jgi:hypothetical protein
MYDQFAMHVNRFFFLRHKETKPNLVAILNLEANATVTDRHHHFSLGGLIPQMARQVIAIAVPCMYTCVDVKTWQKRDG